MINHLTLSPTPTPRKDITMIIEHSATVYAQSDAQLLLGDACDVLAGIPDQTADTVITSPPYFGVRDYGTGGWETTDIDCPHANAPTIGNARRTRRPRICPDCAGEWTDRQHGLESSPAEYVDGLRRVFSEIHRVLKNDGTLWLNLGDSYASGMLGREDAAAKYPGMQATQADRAERVHRVSTGLARKNLLGMPWRVAFVLQDSGWILRNSVVWAKTNPMPNSVRDRFSSTHEMIFLFSKNQRYYFNLDAIRVPHKTANLRSFAKTSKQRSGHDTAHNRHYGTRNSKYANADPAAFAGRHHGEAITNADGHRAGHPLGKNPGDVWHIATHGLRAAHFAAYPEAIPNRAILAASRPGGIVLDPFSGAATTGVAALKLGRRYLGIDLNSEYHEIAKRRILRQAQQFGASTWDGSNGSKPC